MVTLGRVTVVQILDGAEPSVVLSRLARHDGQERTMTVRAGVPDAALFDRLRQQVSPGDTLHVTVESAPEARFRTAVVDFEKR